MKERAQHISNRYNKIRRTLDKMNYMQTFEFNSMQLIEAMIEDLNKYQSNLQMIKAHNARLNDENESLKLSLAAIKHKNSSLKMECSTLHCENIEMKKKSPFNGTNLEIKRLKEEKEDLNFLLLTAKETLIKLEKENKKLKQSYAEILVSLYERNIDRNILKKMYEDLNARTSNIKPTSLENHEDQLNFIVKKRGIAMNSTNFEDDQEKNEFLKVDKSALVSTILKDNEEELKMSKMCSTNCFMPKYNSSLKAVDEINRLNEKINSLEEELKLKDDEIRNLNNQIELDLEINENKAGRDIIIEYLRSELAKTKEKYDNYIQFLMEKGNVNFSKKDLKKSNQEKVQINTTTLADFENQKYSMRESITRLSQENIDLKTKISEMISSQMEQEKKIRDEITNKYESLLLKKREDYQTSFNIIKDLEEKVKEAKSESVSSVQICVEEQKELKKALKVMENANELLLLEKEREKKKAEEQADRINALSGYLLQKETLIASLNETICQIRADKEAFESEIQKLAKFISQTDSMISLQKGELKQKDSEISRLKDLNSMLDNQLKILLKSNI